MPQASVIVVGNEKGGAGKSVVASNLAVSLAQPGEAVLVAGKGHENYQIWGTERRHFDDREEVAEALRPRD